LATQRNDISNYINQINNVKAELDIKKNYNNTLDDTYSRLLYLIDIDNNRIKVDTLNTEIIKTSVEIETLNNKQDIHN
jgi:hypothetical protein